MSIILYDVPSTDGKSWTPNAWRLRFCLGYKGIPFKTNWIEYPDIVDLSKMLGFKPTAKTPWDGTDYYTLPAIHDPSTGVYLADSLLIIEYLEKQYPKTPSIFQNSTIGLQTAFTDAYLSALSPLVDLLLLPMHSVLNPRSKEYYRKTREMMVGAALEDAAPKGERAVEVLSKLKANLERVDGWYAKSDDKGPFMLGDVVSWADLNVAGWNIFMKIVLGEDSKEWKEIESWNGGRWGNILVLLQHFSNGE